MSFLSFQKTNAQENQIKVHYTVTILKRKILWESRENDFSDEVNTIISKV